MRISTNTIFESAVSRINDQQAGLSKIQAQISSGQKILSPSDDPMGAAKALNVNQSKAMNSQYAENRIGARATLMQQEDALNSVTTLLQDVRTQVLSAGNGTFDATSRGFIATELRSRLEALVGMANSRDSVGNYLFGGFKDSEAPFNAATSAASTTVSYSGDNGSKMLQVGPDRQIAVNDNGEALFMKVPASGVFTTSAAGTGSAALTSVAVADKSLALPGHEYGIRFGTGGTSYEVFDKTLDPTMTGTPAASGPYASPQTIKVEGLEMRVSGTPVAGDTVSAKPVRSQSMFATLDNLITALEKPPVTDEERVAFSNNLSIAGSNIDNALTSVLTVRASGGARLQEMDSLDIAGSARDLQFADQLSTLQDVDYVQAISDLNQKQMTLQAAQQSFAKVSNLTLFNYI